MGEWTRALGLLREVGARPFREEEILAATATHPTACYAIIAAVITARNEFNDSDARKERESSARSKATSASSSLSFVSRPPLHSKTQTGRVC